MKKILSFCIILLSIMMLTACQNKEEKLYTFNFYDYMDTFIGVSIQASSEEEAKTYEKEIDEIFKMYHELSTVYEALNNDSLYLENIYSINQKVNQKLEIDQPLYEVLSYALEIQDLTDNYFDISIGKSVDVWKKMMTEVTEEFEVGDTIFLYHYYEGEKKESNKIVMNQTGVIESIQKDGNKDIVLSITLKFSNETITIDRNDAYEKEVSNTVYQKALTDIALLDFSDNQIILDTENQKFYVTIKGDDIKLDLGAVSKGYATQKAYDYILSKEIKNFSITAGSSSIVLGENQKRPEEDGVFYVSLANPVKTEITDKTTYGTVKVKNMSVTTSGNYEQYVLHNGNRYHHIVSPFEKMPVQYYHTVTILGKNAALLDALSTALFSMSPEVMSAWLLKHQDELDIEIIRFNQDSTLTTFLKNTTFEEH